MARPLIVDPDCRNTITGSRTQVMAHFREHGVALWLRANGKATLFFRDQRGRQSQKTWASVVVRWYHRENQYDGTSALKVGGR